MKVPNVEYEYEFVALSFNDGSKDYYLRLSRLVPEFNVVQLKRLEQMYRGRKVIDLGVQTDSILVHTFMAEVKQLNLDIELKSKL